MLGPEDFPVKRTADKVAIVGLYAGTRNLAPWLDESYDIWCLNESYHRMKDEIKRYTMWWEMHNTQTIYNNIYNPSHNHWLAECGVPVVMQEHHDDIPNSVEYPIKKVIAEFGGKYLASTLVYQIIAAWMMGYKRVELYGFTMRAQGEYFKQRPNLEHFMGILKERGVEFWLPEDCDILTGDFYAYEDTVQSIITSADHRSIKREDEAQSSLLQLSITTGKVQLLRELSEAGVAIPDDLFLKISKEYEAQTSTYYVNKGRAMESRALHDALILYGRHRG